MNEKKEKENKTKKPPMSGEKKFYLYTAIACAAVLVAIVTVALLVTNLGKVDAPSANLNSSTVDLPADGPQEEPEENEPVVTLPEGMVLPVEAAVSVDYGFYHNQTLNSYYEHAGVDFSASEGAQVFAVDDGVVESIYKDDLLLGTEIVVAHADGVKSVYRFVTEVDDLKVGAEVKKGDVIATVAAAALTVFANPIIKKVLSKFKDSEKLDEAIADATKLGIIIFAVLALCALVSLVHGIIALITANKMKKVFSANQQPKKFIGIRITSCAMVVINVIKLAAMVVLPLANTLIYDILSKIDTMPNYARNIIGEMIEDMLAINYYNIVSVVMLIGAYILFSINISKYAKKTDKI